MNRIIMVFMALCLSASGFGQGLTPEELAAERLKLKNYAFCECLGFVYKEYDSLWIRDGSTAGYFETSDYAIEVYDTLRSRAEAFSRKVYKSYNNSPLGLMKCLDFYNSTELDSLLRSLDDEIIVENVVSWRRFINHDKKTDTTKPDN